MLVYPQIPLRQELPKATEGGQRVALQEDTTSRPSGVFTLCPGLDMS
jgi:hypothetical protein